MKKKGVNKLIEDSERLLEEVWKDPLVQEYFEKQKKLFKTTLNKAIKRAQKRIEQI